MTFEEFTAARLPALLRFAVVLTGERGLAEDVVQEVLLRTQQRWHKIGSLGSPEHYVRRMIVNEYLSWRRRWSRVTPWAEPPTGPEHAPDHAAIHSEREALRTELDKLPRRQRAVLVLRYYAGLSDTQIAEVLGCTAGTVRGYASRASPRSASSCGRPSRKRSRSTRDAHRGRPASRVRRAGAPGAKCRATLAGLALAASSLAVPDLFGTPEKTQSAAPGAVWKFRFGIDDIPGFQPISYDFAQDRQRVTLAPTANAEQVYGVEVFAAGEYHPAGVRAGEPVLMRGRPGFYRAYLRSKCEDTPTQI